MNYSRRRDLGLKALCPADIICSGPSRRRLRRRQCPRPSLLARCQFCFPPPCCHRPHRRFRAVLQNRLPRTDYSVNRRHPPCPITYSTRTGRSPNALLSVLASSSRLSYNSHTLYRSSFFQIFSTPQPPPAKTETMMGFLSSAVGASKRPRGASVGEEIPEDTEPDDVSILYVPPLPHLYPSSISRRPHFLLSLLPPPSPLPLDPVSIMLAVDTKTEIPLIDFRDENEGSIITSLISQLR